ncbi:MAG: thioredoxin domain-containing protein [Bacteroidetes bacterium]|nr:thioredoxin domain-containing protein [Bacteroidota bacterium]
MSPNRLLNSQSPYLLQHAHNPVEWYPWGPEALTRASEENKPILVSIGYSACHWCHVMEKESFEDAATAELMNAHFVCIKIDREERPDLDNIYMDAVQAMGLQGGWPLNVFLMPNQKPFYGGTYFPNGKWKQLLGSIADAYAAHPDQLAESAEGFGRSLNHKETDKYGIQAGEGDLDPDELVEVIAKLSSQFDPEWGGMNRVPKFPMPAIWHFVLDYALLASRVDLQKAVFFTLRKIGMGGIYDHLRGGFARYSVDGEWFAPHFEKMGYDNGQLLELYAKAYQVSKDRFYLEKVRETKDWLLSEMMQEEGGFHAAQDADSEGVEGKFYTWAYTELEELLGPEFPWFSDLYSLKPAGNWEEGVNILFQVESYEQVAKDQEIPLETFLDKLSAQKANLLQHRNQRIYPGKDDKVLAGWNGLLDAGLIQAYLASGEEEYLELALRNLNFVQQKLFRDGTLYRSYKNGEAYTPAFLEDYAALLKAALMAYSTCGEEQFLAFAQSLANITLARFYDPEDGYFYFSDPSAEKLIANKKELFDNVIPASNSILARSLHQLSLLTYQENYGKIAARMLGGMKELILKEPGFLCNWANFYLESLVPTAEIAIVGRGAKEKALELLANYLPNAVLAWSESPTDSVPLLHGKGGDTEGNALIYVCVNRSCRRPVATVEDALTLVPQLN